MAIQTVTTENLGELAARKSSSPPADVPKSDGPTPGNPVIKAGEERAPDAPPDPGKQPEKDAKPKKDEHPVQARIDELTRARKEAEELFREEYEMRLRIEGELQALKSQPLPKVEEPKPSPEPKPSDYTDQDLFLKDWGKWQREEARKEFAKEQAEARAREEMQKANERLAERIARAKADLPDFEEVIALADRKGADIPPHIKAAIIESELGPQLAYHLAKNPDEQARLFKLSPANALLQLGKIEEKYQPKAKEPEGKPTTPVTTAPEPVARLKDAPAPVSADLSGPMDFEQYKTLRRQQLAQRRRH